MLLIFFGPRGAPTVRALRSGAAATDQCVGGHHSIVTPGKLLPLAEGSLLASHRQPGLATPTRSIEVGPAAMTHVPAMTRRSLPRTSTSPCTDAGSKSDRGAGDQDLAVALASAGGSDRLTDPFHRIGRLDPSMQSTVRHQPSQFAVQGALGIGARVAEPLDRGRGRSSDSARSGTVRHSALRS